MTRQEHFEKVMAEAMKRPPIKIYSKLEELITDFPDEYRNYLQEKNNLQNRIHQADARH